MQIASIKAYQVLDSRGEPTIRVRMESDSGNHARFDAPSSLSVGSREAKERRDNGAAFGGNGVSGNINTIINIIAPKFIGYPLGHQADFDALISALDGTPDKSNLGSNTLAAVSGAYFLLSCYEREREIWQATADILGTTPDMPRIFANMVSGGAHAPGLDVQEFLIIPRTNKVTAAVELIYGIHRTARQIFRSLYGPTTDLVADEGSMAPTGITTETVLEAFEQLSRRNNNAYQIALDMAAYNLFHEGSYTLAGQQLSMQQLGAMYMQWDQRFPLLAIEDPFAENDIDGLKYLLTQSSRKFMVVGDAVTATSAEHIQELGSSRLLGGVVIKLDQTGTVTEMFDAMRSALQSGIKLIISHRSGETNDTYLADIAFGCGAFGVKIGAPLRGERVAKYNRLIEIADDNTPARQANEPQMSAAVPPFIGTPPVATPPAGVGYATGPNPDLQRYTQSQTVTSPPPATIVTPVPPAPTPPTPVPAPRTVRANSYMAPMSAPQIPMNTDRDQDIPL